jgi:murein DD-endopeptidase MepM/ murein hydrolase activator NlpD
MRRSILLAIVLAAAAPRGAGADPIAAFTEGVTRAGEAILDGPQQIATDLVRLQVDARDLVKSIERWLVAWGGPIAPPAPDLSALTASPLPGAENSGFGWRDDPVRGGRKFHKGTDFDADRGTPVHAAGDGIVVYAGRREGYGNVIFLDHGGGIVTRYAHLSKIGVDRGETVLATAVIGKVGSTGRTTGPHLHFEIRIDGRAVDPVLAMQVAEYQRTQPDLGAVLATALAPEIQDSQLDQKDPTNRARGKRPSGRRSQALW